MKETLEEIAEINDYGKNVGIDIGGILYGQRNKAIGTRSLPFKLREINEEKGR